MIDAPITGFGSLRSVDLETLNSQAALMDRKDRKYVVPAGVFDDVMRISGDDLKILEIEGKRSSSYESIYFDTPDFDLYMDAAHDRPRRSKIRTRSYMDTGVCSLEVKRRSPDGFTSKHRQRHSIDERGSLSADDLRFVEECGSLGSVAEELQPSITVRYDRVTLLDVANGTRVTIDTDLTAVTPAGSAIRADGVVIVETKTRGKAGPVDHMLWRGHHRPKRFSKYCTLLAAVTPGLPANRWNRVLKDTLGWSRSR